MRVLGGLAGVGQGCSGSTLEAALAFTVQRETALLTSPAPPRPATLSAMEKFAMGAFAIFLAALAGAILWRLSRWTNCDAVSMAPENPTWTYTGQQLPISYTLPDGTEVRSSLTLDGRSGIPKRGSTIAILYDPLRPTSATRAWTPLVLVAVIGVLLFVAGAAWFS